MLDDGSWGPGEPCPNEACGSSDAFKRHSDGHAHCFACDHHVNAAGATAAPAKPGKGGFHPLAGEVRALTKRGISEDTCRKWGYHIGTFNGRAVQIANYMRDRVVVAQKVRFPDKDFVFLGDGKHCGLYGMHLWRDGGKMVVITEGEIDALSVSQLQNNKWPVVSVHTERRAPSATSRSALIGSRSFESVILMFDNDEPGIAAAKECAPLFSPGKCKIARLELKDANEMLVAGRGAEVIDAIWGAKVYRPDGVVTAADVLEQALVEPAVGDPWCFDGMNAWTYGRRPARCTASAPAPAWGRRTSSRSRSTSTSRAEEARRRALPRAALRGHAAPRGGQAHRPHPPRPRRV
jgi:twinkle protein